MSIKTKTAVFLVLLFLSPRLFASTEQLLQLIDYVGVDYGAAVADGKVVKDNEYHEMQDFVAGITQQVKDLPENPLKRDIAKSALHLSQLVEQKAPADEVRQLTSRLHGDIINAYQVVVIPRKTPDLDKARSLYAEHCASCHGATGRGDGPAGKGLEPPPINFHDPERYRHRTLYGLYSTITQGVSNTSMKAYPDLSNRERWSLAFYVGSMAVTPQHETVQHNPLWDIRKLTTTTPQAAVDIYGDAAADTMAYLRHHPEALFNTSSSILFAKQTLNKALLAYENHDKDKAYEYAVQAYLDGYELVEQNLTALDKDLRYAIEKDMTGLRNRIRSGAKVETIRNEIAAITQRLDKAETLLQGSNLSGGAAFTSAFFILLREGLEALLIIAALAAFLVRTERKDGLAYIHIGWISALVLGFLTWWASVELIDISGASRELTEGIAAVVATLVLLYVGFWLHDKTSAARWKKFIDDNIRKALDSGTLWALAGLSFIAVYREAFETILFYQALWVQTSASGQHMVLAGFVAGAAGLGILAWLIMRYSVRLPLREFFAVTGGLMFVLAIIFAGKGVLAFQEAGLLASSPVTFVRIELLGIYPNLQSLLVQAVLIVLALILWNRKSVKADND